MSDPSAIPNYADPGRTLVPVVFLLVFSFFFFFLSLDFSPGCLLFVAQYACLFFLLFFFCV